MSSSLGARLLRLREEHGWSQADLADQLNITDGSIAHYENNRRYPRKALLIKIARLLKTPPGDLYLETAGRTKPRAA